MKKDNPEQNWGSFAEYCKSDLESAVSELRQILSQYDPINLLSRVAVFILTSNPEKPKDEGGPKQSETNLEYLVSLVTAHPFPLRAKFPEPEIIQKTIELLTIIQMAASWHYRFKRRTISSTPSPLDELINSFRSDKLHVRGEAYWPHLKQTILDLLQPHDRQLKERLGFDSSDYVDFMERTEDQLNERWHDEAETHLDPFMSMYRPWLSDPSDPNSDLDVEGWKAFVADNP